MRQLCADWNIMTQPFKEKPEHIEYTISYWSYMLILKCDRCEANAKLKHDIFSHWIFLKK